MRGIREITTLQCGIRRCGLGLERSKIPQHGFDQRDRDRPEVEPLAHDLAVPEVLMKGHLEALTARLVVKDLDKRAVNVVRPQAVFRRASKLRKPGRGVFRISDLHVWMTGNPCDVDRLVSGFWIQAFGQLKLCHVDS